MVDRIKPKAEKAKPPAKRANDRTQVDHRRQKFVRHFLRYGNGKQAAIHAGYAPGSAAVKASVLLKDDNVRAQIEQAQFELMQSTKTDMAQLIDEAKVIAKGNMGDYFDEWGNLSAEHIATLAPHQQAAIQEISTEVYMEGLGDAAVPVKRTKLKLYSKLAAIDLVAKLTGYYRKGDDPDDQPAITKYTLNIGSINVGADQAKGLAAPGKPLIDVQVQRADNSVY